MNYQNTVRKPRERSLNAIIMPTMELKEIEKIIMKQWKGARPDVYGRVSSDHIVFTPHAFEELKAVIHWAKQTTPKNIFEQQFRMCGYYFRDQLGHFTIVVCYIQNIYSLKRSKVSATIIDANSDTSIFKLLDLDLMYINQGEEELSRIGSKNPLNPFWGTSKDNKLVAVGLGHTHPNMNVFLSSEDLRTHASPVGIPWISLVVNPQKQDMTAICGSEKKSAQVIVFRNDEKAVDIMNQSVKLKKINSTDNEINTPMYKQIHNSNDDYLVIREINLDKPGIAEKISGSEKVPRRKDVLIKVVIFLIVVMGSLMFLTAGSVIGYLYGKSTNTGVSQSLITEKTDAVVDQTNLPRFIYMSRNDREVSISYKDDISFVMNLLNSRVALTSEIYPPVPLMDVIYIHVPQDTGVEEWSIWSTDEIAYISDSEKKYSADQIVYKQLAQLFDKNSEGGTTVSSVEK